jgi:hypothetical protein
MVAWHRPDRFRRVFTGVGTYVGIHGADQLPVWVRKFEPKPIRVFLQSGTGDNNLYCGDWWMANQMMERSLSWAGYEVKHAWGEGGHNQKHASQVFPEAMRWLWREWKTEIEVRANVKGESKWKGYEVVGEGEWEGVKIASQRGAGSKGGQTEFFRLGASQDGSVQVIDRRSKGVLSILAGEEAKIRENWAGISTPLDMGINERGEVVLLYPGAEGFHRLGKLNEGRIEQSHRVGDATCFVTLSDGVVLLGTEGSADGDPFASGSGGWAGIRVLQDGLHEKGSAVFAKGVRTFEKLCVSPDQTVVYASEKQGSKIFSAQLIKRDVPKGGGDPFAPNTEMIKATVVHAMEPFGDLVNVPGAQLVVGGMCVDSNGWLYMATSLGIQVLDQAGRVNFIIPTPRPASDVCFGGKDLGRFFIACGDTIYKRATKARGVVSGQMAPIKPTPPKL